MKRDKSEIILEGARQGARERVEKAAEAVNHAQGRLEIAHAIMMAHAAALEELEKDLAPAKVKDPKSTASGAKKRSPRKPGLPDSTASTEIGKDDVGSVARCAVPRCGQPENAPVHDLNLASTGEGFHIFHAEIKKKAAGGSND